MLVKINMVIKIFKNIGNSLFEVTISLVVTAIVFAIAGTFVAGTVQLSTTISQETASTASDNVSLNILDSDISNYTGSILIPKANLNQASMQFNAIINSVSTTVVYTCYYTTSTPNTVYRKVNSPLTNDLFLENITKCVFSTYKSTDGKTIFINATFTRTIDGQSTNISRVYSVRP